MKTELETVVAAIHEDCKHIMADDSRHYLEVSLANKAAELGLKGAKERYGNTHAIILLKHPLKGMKVRIDGRTFVNYAQFESGVVVPPHIARQSGLPLKSWNALDSMVCNFA